MRKTLLAIAAFSASAKEQRGETWHKKPQPQHLGAVANARVDARRAKHCAQQADESMAVGRVIEFAAFDYR